MLIFGDKRNVRRKGNIFGGLIRLIPKSGKTLMQFLKI